MASAVSVPLLSVEQYLHSVFRPDVDYVDGVLEERNVGDFDHGDVQWALLEAINAYTPDLGIRARPEIRVQVTPTRFRVPDVCVVAAKWKRTQIVLESPLLCVEVLSPGDRLADAIQRSHDYLQMGVPQVWILNPRTRSSTIVSNESALEQTTGFLTIPTTAATIDLAAIFAVLEM